jgi:hypothetical protein
MAGNNMELLIYTEIVFGIEYNVNNKVNRYQRICGVMNRTLKTTSREKDKGEIL